MVVTMTKAASTSPAEIDEVKKTIRLNGLQIHYSQGQERVVIGVIGSDSEAFEKCLRELQTMTQVEEVHRVTKKYRRSSRDFQAHPSIIDLNGHTTGGPVFTIAAGPCSVEDERTMHDVARALVDNGVWLMRGGAYKPRTAPDDFQGLEVPGLKLLQKVGREYGLLTITEAISEGVVDLVAEHADIVQVGARSMQSTQLLKKLARCGKPVLLKRGMSATLEEFLCAAEYIVRDNPRVILCLRGIRTFEPSMRNTSDIDAIAKLHRLTHLPVWFDPSHSTGDRFLVADMACAAIGAGCDGLMVEIHPDPKHAWSDGQQSMDFSQFGEMVNRVNARIPTWSYEREPARMELSASVAI